MATERLYSTETTDGVCVATFRPSHILDAMTIERMATGLKDIIEAAPEGRFVFDFTKVTYLSSSALGMLIGLQRRILGRQGQLKLVGINDEVMEVFQITKLDTVFDIYKDSAAACEAYRKNL